MRTKMIMKGVFWGLLYLLLVLLPVLVMFIAPHPVGREFWRELSVSLGFIGLALVALQFALTARFKWLKSPYGADIVYHFHRQISFVAGTLILAHPLLLFIFSPDTLRLLLVWSAPWRARAAVTAFLAIIGLVALSVWRKKLKIEYKVWRVTHAVLALAAVSFALIHILLVGHYVNLPWKRLLWIVYGLFWLGLLFYTRIIKPLLLLRRPYKVDSVKAERGNTWTVEVVPVDHKGFTFMPGQFAWITLWDSPFADSEHPFSISSSAQKKGSLSFTIKALGYFTSRVPQLRPGDKMYVDGPFGSFSCDRHPHAEELVFIPGGVGITPIMSMLRTLADRGDERPLTLIYANKLWDEITFREEIAQLSPRLNINVVYVLETPHPEWDGEKGFVNRPVLERYMPDFSQRGRLDIFVCGPPPMMNAIERTLDQMGVWPGDVHSERFDLV